MTMISIRQEMVKQLVDRHNLVLNEIPHAVRYKDYDYLDALDKECKQVEQQLRELGHDPSRI